MLYTIHGDIFGVQQGIICHQVNCMGKMGAGLALSIRKKWPKVYEDYMAAFHDKHLRLGVVILTHIVPGQLCVASLCGQYYYGRGRVYTNYPALKMCFNNVERISKSSKLPVYIPYGMGCTLAGGNWKTVYSIIASEISNGIIVVKQDGTK